MHDDSLLTGDNAAYIDEKYRQWLVDPRSVEPTWAAEFEGWDRPETNGHLPGVGPSFRAPSIFHGGGRTSSAEVLDAARKQAKVAQLINAYRVRGHLRADIDPLGRLVHTEHPELTLEYYGLSSTDLDRTFATAPLYGMPEMAPLRHIVTRCNDAYCSEVGAEYMNIDVVDQKQWVAEQLERLPDRNVLTRREERRVLGKLADAENFERMLHTRYPGTKRFSVEGAETLIPLLDVLISRSAQGGIAELVVGMAHRGRLNVLANVFEKPVRTIIEEFEDVRGGEVQGSGDVKYHLGISTDVVTVHGDRVHLSLTPNPSHLEAVTPVVLGRVRAKQDRFGDGGFNKCMAVLIHGDAAFAGQGVVQEILQLSELEGYKTGGTVHIIVNNQVGFTTTSSTARSTPYASGVARMLGIPILHVNGESPRAVAAAVQIAVDWRQRFHRDVVIDMYCYRKYGHNEGDEPAFTQPVMYKAIRSRKTPMENYGLALVDRGWLTPAEAESIATESLARMTARIEPPTHAAPKGVKNIESKGQDPDAALYFSKAEARANTVASIETGSALLWEGYVNRIGEEVDTSVPLAALVDVLERANTLPDSFNANAKVLRLLKQRLATAHAERPVDWAVAEQAAFATLLGAGYSVRLSGQDSGRGTFSHRHANLVEVETARVYTPLDHLADGQPMFRVWDSNLSEFGVLGFEFGYSLDTPDGLVLWEAQFGDFANGAQVILDQFLTASEQKWNRYSGLVMLLPHGYEGQGPEHSSARIERYLQGCAEGNVQVAAPTTPANFFHLLRRQVLRKTRKPLIVFTPKSGLRHGRWVSSLGDLSEGGFQHVIRDPFEPASAKRIIFCSGKVYYDLEAAREEHGVTDVAIHRLEMLHPFPVDEIRKLMAVHPHADVVWCQEEPRNMGPWPVMLDWWCCEFADRVPSYIGRRATAATAGGSHQASRGRQQALVNQALSIS